MGAEFEMLSDMRNWINVMEALEDAVLRAGGDENVLRQVEDPEVADEIAALLMTRAGIPKPVPDVTGLEVFQIEVNGDDPQRLKILANKYSFCSASARTGDFPIRRGRRMVKCALFPKNYFNHFPTNQEVMEEIARRNLGRPDRVITEEILDNREAELAEKPIAGICGVVQTDTKGDIFVGSVSEHMHGRRLELHRLQNRWPAHYRFIAVVSEEMR